MVVVPATEMFVDGREGEGRGATAQPPGLVAPRYPVTRRPGVPSVSVPMSRLSGLAERRHLHHVPLFYVDLTDDAARREPRHPVGEWFCRVAGNRHSGGLHFRECIAEALLSLQFVTSEVACASPVTLSMPPLICR